MARFEIPRGTIVPVASVDVRLDPEPHPFELENMVLIEENWRREHAANPRLYDGTLTLPSELKLNSRGELIGRCHVARFATMLYWRKNKGSPDIEHCFAQAALVAGDGALIAVRMGQHTANAGRVYFAAGSFEPEDFIDGRADTVANMHREVMEETGLDLTHTPREPGYHLHSINGSTMLFRRYYLDEAAETVADRIRAFVASEVEPEIEGPVIVRSARDLPEGTLNHLAAVARWHFT
jgi:8-oxo-dGTP pyrophosphatase MutT (NUDIX family)